MNPTVSLGLADVRHVSPGNGCEFCEEFADPRLSRFGDIYGARCSHRIVAEQSELVALPTLGQLFKASILVLPRAHFETMAELPQPMIQNLDPFLMQLEDRIGAFGTLILFEHGAKCTTGGSCGVYHAHLHLVAVPKKISWTDVLPTADWVASNLTETLERLRNADHYLMFRDTSGVFAATVLPAEPSSQFPSQYFRRALAEHFDLQAPWDWREYTWQEPRMLETLACFGVQQEP